MRRSTLLVSLLGFALTACDTQGLFPLGAKRDTLVPCSGPTSTWLRSTPDRTEVLVLGSADPTAPVPLGAEVCFAYGWVAHDSSTYLETGSYSLESNGVGVAAYNDSFDFVYDSSTAIISRRGAVKHHTASPVRGPLTITADGAVNIRVTYHDEMHRWTALPEVIEMLDLTSQSGAEDVFRVFNLPLFTSQVRVGGFGSGRMTQYVLSTPAQFNGIIANNFTVIVDSNITPHTTFTYFQFEELSGIKIDGHQQSLVNISGAGPMTGILSFVMLGHRLSGGAANPIVNGTIDYANVTINKGVAGGGTYALDVDGTGPTPPFAISYTQATNIDLRGVLPIATP